MQARTDLRIIRLLLIIISIPVVVIVLKSLKSIFIPLIIAMFLAFLFAPLTSYLKKRHIPMFLILAITLVIIALFFTLVIMLLYAASNSLINGIPNYQNRFAALVLQVTQYFQTMVDDWGITSQDFTLVNLSHLITGSFVSIPTMLSTTMNTVLDFFWNLFLVVVFLIFMLLESDKLQFRLKKVMSHTSKDQTFVTLKSIQVQIHKYLTVKTLISLATAIVGVVLMLAYGVDFVLVCGLLLFVLNYIPNIGSIIATAIPIVICALQGGIDIRLITFSMLMIGTQMLFGNILEPRIQGNRLNLTPIMVVVSLIFWGWLWGIVGMLICVPLTSAINIILKQIAPDNIVSAVISSE